MSDSRVLRPRYVWIDDRFIENQEIVVTDGTIETIGPSSTGSEEETAILPGFVNAHSHSFQRAIRGRTESFPRERGSFWSWRAAMYETAEALTPTQMYDWNVQAFREMLDAGITTVGEFHYLHHDAERDYALDEALIEAASDARIRLVLLEVFYGLAGPGKPLTSEQRRFGTGDTQEFLSHLDQIRRRHESDMVRFGIVAHSLRAVSPEDVETLWGAAVERDLPFHMHVEEQRREIEELLEATGERPMELLLRRLDLDQRFTAIHCTHTRPDELAELVRRGANVCITPLTEANLGDGLRSDLAQFADHICLGTDSNARISMIEEMRWLEYGQRLRNELRGAFAGEHDQMAETLLRAATINGARSLGVAAGRIEPGAPADFAIVDLSHPSLRGHDPETLLATIITGADNGVVCGAIVNGADA